MLSVFLMKDIILSDKSSQYSGFIGEEKFGSVLVSGALPQFEHDVSVGQEHTVDFVLQIG